MLKRNKIILIAVSRISLAGFKNCLSTPRFSCDLFDTVLAADDDDDESDDDNDDVGSADDDGDVAADDDSLDVEQDEGDQADTDSDQGENASGMAWMFMKKDGEIEYHVRYVWAISFKMFIDLTCMNYVQGARASHVLVDLGWVDSDLCIPLSFPAGQPLLPNFYRPTQNQADSGTFKIQVNPTQVNEQMGCPVSFIRYCNREHGGQFN